VWTDGGESFFWGGGKKKARGTGRRKVWKQVTAGKKVRFWKAKNRNRGLRGEKNCRVKLVVGTKKSGKKREKKNCCNPGSVEKRPSESGGGGSASTAGARN